MQLESHHAAQAAGSAGEGGHFWRQAAQESVAENESLREQLARAEGAAAGHERAAQTLQEQQQQQQAAHERQIAELNARHAQATAQHGVAQQRVIDLQEQLTQTHNRHSETQAQHATTVADLEQQLNAERGMVQTLRSERNRPGLLLNPTPYEQSRREELARLRQQAQAEADKVQAAERAVREKSFERSEAANHALRLSQELDGIQARLAQVQAERTRVGNELQQAIHARNEAAHEVTRVRALAQARVEERQREADAHVRTAADLRRVQVEARRLGQDLAAAHAAERAADGRVRWLEAQATQEKARADRLAEAHAHAQQEQARVRQLYDQMTGQLGAVQNELQHVLDDRRAQRSSIDNLRTDLGHARAQIEHAQQQHQAAIAKAAVHQARVAELERELAALRLGDGRQHPRQPAAALAPQQTLLNPVAGAAINPARRHVQAAQYDEIWGQALLHGHDAGAAHDPWIGGEPESYRDDDHDDLYNF